MFLKSHKWVDIPITRYERYREMRVRESVHTVMIWDKRYFNSETLKFDSDKIQTLNHESLLDLIENNECYGYHNYPTMFGSKDYEEERSVFNFPKFVPKDDDFDEEEDIHTLCENVKKEQIAKEEKAIAEQKEKIYQLYVKEVEDRLEREMKVLTTGPLSGKSFCNVRPNTWKPK